MSAPESTRGVRIELALVALVLLGPILAFFAPTFAAGNAPGGFDLLYQHSPWRDQQTRPLDAQSPAQADQAEQLPWVEGIWESIREGELAMWTPTVGGGTSLGTNPVFATFSVFTVAGAAVGGGAVGLAVRVVAAVVVGQLFMYLFLRRVGAGRFPSAFGAVAYVFSGAVIVFETRNAIPLLLPVMMWCTDRLAERVSPGRVVALAATVVAVWLEGFPAMLVHALALSGLWLTVRVAPVNWRARPQGWWRSVLLRCAGFGGAIGLGVMLSAFSAIPFALQLKYNDVFGARAAEASTIPRVAAWWLVDERGLGQPDRGPWYMGLSPFEGLSAVGTIVLGLAIVGTVVGLSGRRDQGSELRRARIVFALIAAVLSITIFLGGPLLDLLYEVPGFAGNPFWRIRYVLVFALAALAALALGSLAGGTETTAQPDPTRRDRVVGGAAAVALMAAVGAPLLLSLQEYRSLMRTFSDEARSAWTSELLLLLVAGVVVGLFLLARRWPERPRLVAWRSPALVAVLGLLVFVQVGAQLTRFTPQVDREFFFPATSGEAELRRLTGDQYRFIGSGMGTFAPNSAMLSGLIDARSHSFRDPEWKAMLLRVFPDATALDPLKVNVDFRGRVDWGAPVFNDLALGVFVMSSSEVPLGDRQPLRPAESWVDARGSGKVSSDGPVGPHVGVDVWLRTEGDCGQGVIEVTSVASDVAAVARRPLGDVIAAAGANTSVPFALPRGELADGVSTKIDVGLAGAPPDCRLLVGTGSAPSLIEFAPILRPDDAPWQMAVAEQGWMYRRPGAEPLVRLIADWVPVDRRASALQQALDPRRDSGDPMPVFGVGPPPASSGAPDGSVRSWRTDASGLSAVVSASQRSVLVAAFNSAPGWTVSVDGEPARLAQPDGALLGVELPEGEHTVRFDYVTPGLRSGTLITLVGVVICVSLLLAGPFRARWRARRLTAREPDRDGPDASGGQDEASTGTPAGVAPD